MVICNDFEVKIVSADSKTPFKEHEKGGKTYVEVEPDAEYFLTVQRVRSASNRLLFRCAIDGKDTGTYNDVRAGSNTSRVYLKGISSRSNGVKRKKAFKFVKASFTSGGTDVGSTMAGMGNVEVNVYNAIHVGESTMKDCKRSFTASSIKIEDSAPVTMKKDLRSGEGQSVETSTYDTNKSYKRYTKGDHLYTITLYYCATPGLIAVGILPKPPAWEWLRMNKPAQTTAEEKEKLNKAVISVKRNRKGNEILELADSDDESDSDTEDENSVHPDRAISSHKKARI